MARIDRLNYRDIGVIKAPLCQKTLLSKGVDKTRDSDSWHQGFHFPLRRSRLVLPLDPTRPAALSLPRSPLADAFLISHYPRTADAPSTDRRFFHASGVFNHATYEKRELPGRTPESVRLKKVCLKNSSVEKESLVLFGEEARKYRYRNSHG